MWKNEHCLIFWTTNSLSEAKKVATALIEKKWVACASLLNPVFSLFYWKDRVEQSQEIKVILKTRSDFYSDIEKYILDNCSYEVPEILRIDIAAGNPAYIQWIDASLQRIL